MRDLAKRQHRALARAVLPNQQRYRPDGHFLRLRKAPYAFEL
jgi:hypothetical protein